MVNKHETSLNLIDEVFYHEKIAMTSKKKKNEGNSEPFGSSQ
ncbi:unnamed protein product, partial [Heterotrigona itama]